LCACFVCLALQGWPGPKPFCKQGESHETKKLERDFTSLNRGWIDLGLAMNRESHAYRSVYDVRKREETQNVRSLRKAPLVFPPGFVFGQPPRCVE